MLRKKVAKREGERIMNEKKRAFLTSFYEWTRDRVMIKTTRENFRFSLSLFLSTISYSLRLSRHSIVGLIDFNVHISKEIEWQ